MEFVMNNGRNEWDNHDPWGKKDNYKISGEGKFELKDGKLKKL